MPCAEGRKLRRISGYSLEQGVHEFIYMWNKDSNPAIDTPPSSPAPAENLSVGDGALIGETMRIEGEIYSKDELRLNGEMVGKLESLNRLTVGVKGKAEASIKASEVVIAGAVTGNVEATQRIVLRKGANLVGDVKTAGIVIEDGAFFRGGIDIARPEVPKVVAR
jgi:cytoskeletal protein CcmA (bactofilin family)